MPLPDPTNELERPVPMSRQGSIVLGSIAFLAALSFFLLGCFMLIMVFDKDEGGLTVLAGLFFVLSFVAGYMGARLLGFNMNAGREFDPQTEVIAGIALGFVGVVSIGISISNYMSQGEEDGLVKGMSAGIAFTYGGILLYQSGRRRSASMTKTE